MPNIKKLTRSKWFSSLGFDNIIVYLNPDDDKRYLVDLLINENGNDWLLFDSLCDARTFADKFVNAYNSNYENKLHITELNGD